MTAAPYTHLAGGSPVAQASSLSVSLRIVSFGDDFSGGQSESKLLRGGFLGGNQSGEDSSARFGDLVAMGMRELANQSMCAQQTQLAPDCCGTATGRFFIPWLACIKSFLEVAIAQSCNRPLASAQGTEQGGISPQWLEASIASIGVGVGSHH